MIQLTIKCFSKKRGDAGKTTATKHMAAVYGQRFTTKLSVSVLCCFSAKIGVATAVCKLQF